MKIALAQWQCSLFQIGPAFRRGENGVRHRHEFQMLEWYRWQANLAELQHDLQNLLTFINDELSVQFSITDLGPVQSIQYKDLFAERFSVNPHQVSVRDLNQLAIEQGLHHLSESTSRADLLDGLFTIVERSLIEPVLVSEYPACQSALAELKIDAAGDEVSDRFELFAGGVELANAYQELLEPDLLRARLESFNEQRLGLGKPRMKIDEGLVSAGTHISKAAGIALGIDRLAMVLLGERNIEEVLV